MMSNLTLSLTTKAEIKHWMELCRASTLALFQGIEDEIFRSQAHPDFSPVGWHLGHIAYTEALWLLGHCAKKHRPFREYDQLFAADGLPKHQRCALPSLAEIQEFLAVVRNQVFDYLDVAPFPQQERMWRWILQHESQHCEIITMVLKLHGVQSPIHSFEDLPEPKFESVEIPAGKFWMGDDSIDSLDNERSPQEVELDTYWIDRYPVTCGQFQQFIEAGGYQNPQYWSSAGWTWRENHHILQPLYWQNDALWQHHPVYGVSFYEAEAYANFVGKRLPTEAEWEKAARWNDALKTSQTYPWGETFPTTQCNHHHQFGHTSPVNAFPDGNSPYGVADLLGNVWEWTSTWFEGYPGFESYPYPGYSQTYFDGQHRVLRGGSWATRPWALRSSFRNWYYPWVRQIFAGFRCVQR